MTKFEFSRVLLVALNGAAVNENKNLVKILAEQNVRPHLSASDATLVTVVLISIFRLNPLITPPVEKSPMMTLTLQEVLIVGSCSDQVKFSELTLDMFRMLQTLEREPQEDLVQMYDASPAPGRMPLVRTFFYFFGSSYL